MLVPVRAVRSARQPFVEVELTDGRIWVLDLTPYLAGEILEPVRTDAAYFAQVRVDPELRALCWPNGADIDPDVLLGDRVPV